MAEWRRSTSPAGSPPAGLLVGLAGFFADACRRSSQPGLPTVREFQRAQYVAALDWVRRRTGSR